MIIKQLSIFIENKKGHLASVTKELKKQNIDIRAISVFDTSEFGILRLVVDDPDQALETLENAGYTAKVTPVLAIQPKDKPGSLNEVFMVLDENDIEIEYIYSFVLRKKDAPLIIFKVNNQEKTIKVLQKANITVISKEEVYGK